MAHEIAWEAAPLRTWATGRGRFLGFLRRLVREKPLGAFGAAIVVAMLAMALLADLLAPYPYDTINLADILTEPNADHLLGTDFLGRDLLSRIIFGGRVSIYVALTTVVISVTIATTLGVLSGWLGGRVDALIQQLLVNTWIALPALLILLALASIIGPGLFTVVFILSLGGISGSRVVRSSVMSIKSAPFIEAAQAMGATTPWIMLRHIVPNTFAPVIILASIDFGRIILAEATLSFLGFGVPPPFPTWGQMLSGDSLSHFHDAPWTMLWPGLVLTLAVFGSNVFGDALRDLLDPRLRGAGKH
ncbi:MAG: ABC transporter permease [Dehalococcoidia bacterium]|nr:ABC transporter permease [Dehalococcoidia bacterium]